MKRRAIAYKLLMSALGCISVATVVVCGIGLHLTAQWYRNLQDIRIRAEERNAVTQVSELRDALSQEERSALAALAIAGPQGSDLSRIVASGPFLERPFFILENGEIVVPDPDRKSGTSDPLDAEEALPRHYEQTFQIAMGPGPESQRLESLHSIHVAPDLPPTWRLRAQAMIAAIHLRRGEPEEAASIYAAILEDFGDHLAHTRTPSPLHFHLAYIEALLASSDTIGAIQSLTEVIDQLMSGELYAELEEEAFFLDRSQTLLERAGLPPLRDLAAAQEILRARHRAVSDAESLRDIILREPPRSRNEIGGPRHFTPPFGDRVVHSVWTRSRGEEIPAGLLAYGFQIDVNGLQRFLQEQLSESDPGESLQVLMSPGGQVPDETVALARFPDDLNFFSVGLQRAHWDEIVGQAKRPFVFAAGLLILLGLLLLTGLFIIFRGIKREFNLSRMKTEFVANVSHELKTPLALIRLCGETLLLERVRDQEQSKKYLHIVTRESIRLGHLISNMLDFSSIEAGKKSYVLKPIDIKKVVESTIDKYKFHLEEKGFELDLDLDSDLPLIDADDEAIEQALINLLQNAVLYAQRLKKIEVKAEVADGSVRVSVQDYGDGIPPEDQKKIWEDYYRTGTARAKTRGSGLGLSLVQHIVEAHGGKVELVSEDGKGSRFTLAFPALHSAIREENHESENPGR